MPGNGMASSSTVALHPAALGRPRGSDGKVRGPGRWDRVFKESEAGKEHQLQNVTNITKTDEELPRLYRRRAKPPMFHKIIHTQEEGRQALAGGTLLTS